MNNNHTPSMRELGTRLINYYPIFAKITGSTTVGVFLSQCYFLENSSMERRSLTVDGQTLGFWFHTTDQWTDELGMSYDEIKNARNKLISLGILQEKKAGIPAKVYYRINCDRIVELVNKFIECRDAGNAKVCFRECLKQDSDIPENKDWENPNTSIGDSPILDQDNSSLLYKEIPDTSDEYTDEYKEKEEKNVFEAENFASSTFSNTKGNEKNNEKEEINNKNKKTILPAKQGAGKKVSIKKKSITSECNCLDTEKCKEQKEQIQQFLYDYCHFASSKELQGMLTGEQRALINTAAAQLHKHERTARDLERWAKWYERDDWRGKKRKKGIVTSPFMVSSTWTLFVAAAGSHAAGVSRTGNQWDS